VQNIIEEILAGNTDRFRVILQEYRDELLRVAFHFLQDWDEAEDVTQLTFIACFRHLRQYDPSRPFRPWLLRIHWNQCKSAARRRQLRRLFFAPVEQADPSIAGPEPGDETLILREIHKLPFKQRTAFILVEIENYSPMEAAQVLHCADSTLRVHLARAKQKLRERLLRYGF
jgi:RNA polymerase sigma factor CnrH